MTSSADTSDSERAESDGELIGLRDAAEQLDVHYMTAYRYVRTGRLAAEKRAGRWWVRVEDVANVFDTTTNTVATRPRSELVRPLGTRMANSDYPGSWQLLEGVLASGATPTEIYDDLLAPAMRQIGQEWRSGNLTIAEEHRATAICQRLLGRMSSLFLPVGRRRGSVLLGVTAGDAHGLASAMLADILEAEHLAVIDLGANTPLASFIEVAREIDDLVGIGIATSVESAVEQAAAACEVLMNEFPDVTVVLGGAAISNIAPGELEKRVDVVTRSSEEARRAFVAAAQRRQLSRTSSTSSEAPVVG